MSGLSLRWLVLAVAVAGCREAPPAAAPDAAVTAPAAAPAAGATLAERQARFEGRAVIALPAELPAAWARMVRSLGARPTGLRHEVRTSAGKEGWRLVELDLRLFGEDAAVEAKLVEALGALGLPGLDGRLPVDAVEAGPVRWSVQVDRLVAPPGQAGEPVAREQIVRLRWQRTPPAPAEAVKCRKPLPVDAPAVTPAWLAEVTSRRSTRQRITAAVKLDAAKARVEQRMLFHNGFAHDEQVGDLAAAAARAGFARVEGEGPRQRWQHADGSVLAFRPDTADDLGLGCTLAGPVIAIEWSGPAPVTPKP